jgi:hypothetical protein
LLSQRRKSANVPSCRQAFLGAVQAKFEAELSATLERAKETTQNIGLAAMASIVRKRCISRLRDWPISPLNRGTKQARMGLG